MHLFGPPPIRYPRAVAAYHEAGHATVAMAQGIEVRQVWISDGAPWTGYTAYAQRPPPITPSTPAGVCIATAHRELAGWMAELVFVPEHFHPLSAADELRIGNAIVRQAAERSGRDAVELLHESFMHRLVKKLEQKNRMREGTVKRLIDEHVGCDSTRPKLTG